MRPTVMWEERVHIYGTPEVLNNYPGLNKKKKKKKGRSNKCYNKIKKKLTNVLRVFVTC